MGPWGVIRAIFRKTDPLREMIAATNEFKILKDEYRGRMEKAEGRIHDLEIELAEMREHERDCHRLLIKANEQNLLLKTELLFIKKEKK